MKLSRRTWQTLFLILLAIVAIGIPTLRRIEPNDAPNGGRTVLRVLSPAVRTLSWLDERVTGVFTGIRSLATAQSRATRLEGQVAELQREISSLREALRQVGEWPALVAMAEAVDHPTVAVQVIARSPHASHRTLLIDVGEDDGVHAGIPIVNPDGLVGTVSQSAPHTSVVRLLMGENVRVTARIADEGCPGTVAGVGEFDRLEFIPQDQGGELHEGMELVTAGMESSIYPPGVPIGTITEIVNTPRGVRQANVQPAVDFRRLNQMLAIVGRPQRIRPLEGSLLLGVDLPEVAADTASIEESAASPELTVAVSTDASAETIAEETP